MRGYMKILSFIQKMMLTIGILFVTNYSHAMERPQPVEQQVGWATALSNDTKLFLAGFVVEHLMLLDEYAETFSNVRAAGNIPFFGKIIRLLPLLLAADSAWYLAGSGKYERSKKSAFIVFAGIMLGLSPIAEALLVSRGQIGVESFINELSGNFIHFLKKG